LRNLSLGALGERLDRALPLLTGGARDAPARHRTLRVTIAWSHDLLSLEERALFRCLAVFAGGWTLEAAEVVCTCEGGSDILSVLGSLTDKSLVWLDESGAAPRYRMLETIREFAAEQLHQHGEDEAALHRAHAAFFTALISAAESGLCAGVMADVRRVEADLDNLRATLAWLLAAGDAETTLRVAAALSEYWTFAGGQFSEGRGWLEQALTLGVGPSESARAGANYGLATMALHQADLAAAGVAATAGLTLARSAPDARWVAANAYMLSTVERIEGRHEAALALAVESEVAAGASGKGEWVGWSALLRGAARHATGDLADAVSACEEALDTFRHIEGRWGEAFATESLALAVGAQGDRRRAAALHARGMELRHEIGTPTGIENDFIGLANLAHAAGDFRVAAVLLGAGEAYEARFGIAPLGDSTAIKECTQAAVMDQLGAAAFQSAWAEGRELSHDEAVTAALAVAATLA
jgi:non-specific serine/threonine protein kinase